MCSLPFVWWSNYQQFSMETIQILNCQMSQYPWRSMTLYIFEDSISREILELTIVSKSWISRVGMKAPTLITLRRFRSVARLHVTFPAERQCVRTTSWAVTPSSSADGLMTKYFPIWKFKLATFGYKTLKRQFLNWNLFIWDFHWTGVISLRLPSEVCHRLIAGPP